MHYPISKKKKKKKKIEAITSERKLSKINI
jgi:hypothetical protein